MFGFLLSYIFMWANVLGRAACAFIFMPIKLLPSLVARIDGVFIGYSATVSTETSDADLITIRLTLTTIQTSVSEFS